MKRIIFIIVLVLTMTGTSAQHITEQEALDRAMLYMSSMNGSKHAPSRGVDSKPESAPVQAESIYAFNLKGGGFIIASADNRTLPVLGYSTTGSIDWDNLPPNMQEWLRSYDEAIATLGDRIDFKDGNALDNTGPLMATSSQDRKPVEPLIKTRWSQDEPYYNECPLYEGDNPEYNGKICVTGCTATALAQVMRYYEWPKTVPDGLPDYETYTRYNGTKKTWHIDALPPVTFDWANMLDDYDRTNPDTNEKEQLGNDTQRSAVATLMRYCGQAIKTEYTPAASSGQMLRYIRAFIQYFGYSDAELLTNRQYFGVDEWEDIIYDEVSNGRPVLYCGYQGTSSGHAFICDGYDGNGLFHINWGWRGQDDGYYSLSVLNPYDKTSTGSDIIGFSINQSAVVHINPTEKMEPIGFNCEDESYLHENISLLNGNTVKYQFSYNNEDAGKVSQDYALGTIADDGALNPVFIGDPSDSILYDVNSMTVVIDSTRFQPGDSLRLYPMYRIRKTGAEWKVIPPLESHLVAGRTDNGTFFIGIHAEFHLECEGGAITKGIGRLGEGNNITVRVRNLAEDDYINTLYLVPTYYGHINKDQINDSKPLSQGEQMQCGAYIHAGRTDCVTFAFVPQQSGVVLFKLKAADKDLGDFCLELDSDTLVNYEKYLVNNSRVSQVGDQWFYDIELCDKPGVQIPLWIPSDSIVLKGRFYRNHERIGTFYIYDEIREYLKDLPLKGGKGDYRFTWQIPLDITTDGLYFVDSYLGEQVDGYLYDDNTIHEYEFNVNITDVLNPPATATDEPYYDLLGRPIDGISERKGFYIKGNRTVFIK